MKSREKLLAAVLLGALVVGWGTPRLRDWYFADVDALDAELALVRQQSEKFQTELDQAMATAGRWSTLTELSLHRKPEIASLQYQQWVGEMAEAVGRFEDLRIAPEVPRELRGQPITAVRLTVTGTTTSGRWFRWLFDMQRAAVLHRVVSWRATRDERRPGRLVVRVVWEGLSLREATRDGETLFPVVRMTGEVDRTATDWPVTPREDLPDPPFRARAGSEFVIVRQVGQSGWSVQRGADGSAPQPHPKGESVEVFPLRADAPSLDDRLEMLKYLARHSLFSPPFEGSPELRFPGLVTVRQGQRYEAQAQVRGLPEGATVSFRVGEGAPPGLQIDSHTGAVRWEVPSDLKPGDYFFDVVAESDVLDEPLSVPVFLTVEASNDPPRLVGIENPSAIIGRPFRLTLKAEDDRTPPERLRFELEEGPPGAAVEGNVLRWDVPEDFTPGTVTFRVRVSDDGDPPQSSTAEFSVEVGDDLAQFTYLTGIVMFEGRQHAWLYDRVNNRRVELRPGDRLRYAGVDAIVRRIERERIVLEQAGIQWELELGGNLASMKPLTPPSATDKRDGAGKR
ncbi:MAG: cadherin repeat domain-containing protein [Planctomycetota bacterium]|nr:MAG: cadherin repeat domain-containing protein [Planctomycetota bacterium]